MSDTPIFDSLAAARGYYRMLDKKVPTASYVAPRALSPVPVPVKDQNTMVLHLVAGEEPPDMVDAPKAWIAKEIPVVDPKNIRLSEDIEPEEAEEKYGTFAGFVQHKVEEFHEKYPTYKGKVEVTVSSNIDGTERVTVKADVEDTEGRGVRLVKPLPKRQVTEDFIVRGLAEKLPPVKKNIVSIFSPEDDMVTPSPTWDEIQKGIYEDFAQKHPDAFITDAKLLTEADGSAKLEITAIEPKMEDVPEEVRQQQLELYKGVLAIDAGADKPPTYDELVKIAEALRGDQRVLVLPEEGAKYQKPPRGYRADYAIHDEFSAVPTTNEQTDDGVNAALTDETIPMQKIDPSLRISDEEIANEE